MIKNKKILYFVKNIVNKSMNNINIDILENKWYNYIKKNILTEMKNDIKLKYTNEELKKICISINNSKSINVFMERLTETTIIKNLIKNEKEYKIYSGINMSDHSYEFEDCYIHIDNKGVEIKNEKTIKVTKNEKKELIKKYGENYENIIINNETNNEDIKYIIDKRTNELKKCIKCDDYEMFNDDKDYNLHFKESQSTLSGFEGKFSGKDVIFNGKLPLHDKKPHLCYIIKHVYGKESGIKKLILYSIPHKYNQEIYYKDIQYELKKKRINKAKDEFRFNMNDEDNNIYKFISNKEEERYNVVLI